MKMLSQNRIQILADVVHLMKVKREQKKEEVEELSHLTPESPLTFKINSSHCKSKKAARKWDKHSPNRSLRSTATKAAMTVSFMDYLVCKAGGYVRPFHGAVASTREQTISSDDERNTSSFDATHINPIHLLTLICFTLVAMEDAHTSLLQLPGADKLAAFFAVFDGHGGAFLLCDTASHSMNAGERVAQFAGERMHQILVSRPEFKSCDYGNALIQTFLQTDTDILAGMQPFMETYEMMMDNPLRRSRAQQRCGRGNSGRLFDNGRSDLLRTSSLDGVFYILNDHVG